MQIREEFSDEGGDPGYSRHYDKRNSSMLQIGDVNL